MSRPRDKRAEIWALLKRLDEPTAGAVLTIIEVMGIVNRRQASRLIEAVAHLVARAPRRQTGGAR